MLEHRAEVYETEAKVQNSGLEFKLPRKSSELHVRMRPSAIFALWSLSQGFQSWRGQRPASLRMKQQLQRKGALPVSQHSAQPELVSLWCGFLFIATEIENNLILVHRELRQKAGPSLKVQ